VLAAAARLVSRHRRYDHITDAVVTLHWLRLPERVEFKVALTAFRVLHGLAPPCLCHATPCHAAMLVRDVANLPGRPCLRSEAKS